MPILVLLLLIAPAQAGEPTWARSTVPGSTVSVELLGEVEVRHAEKFTPIGKVVSDTLVVEPDGGWIAATVTHAPSLALRMAGEKTVLGQAKTSVLDDTKGKQVSWEPIERGGKAGMRLTFTLTGANGAAQNGVSEVFTFDGMVMTFTSALEPRVAEVGERFRRSLQFGPS